MSIGCGGSDPTDGQAASNTPKITYPYTIVTTVGMVNDIVARVAGDKATVTNIIGEGVDPHLYKPTTSDVKKLLSADVIFYCGLVLEGKMADTLVKSASSVRYVFAVTDLLDEQYLLEPKEFSGHYDPHVWMDVQAWSKAVESVCEALARYDLSNADHYRANARSYGKKLVRLDDYARTSIASIPDRRRVLITAHDAFNYFSRAYGIEVQGIQGISTESEAGLKRINYLVDTIIQRDIGAVFIETSVPVKNVKALIEGAAARGKTVKIGGQLFSDAMGKPGSYEGSYIGMIDHNATTVTRALGGNAPSGGMQGKLSGDVNH